MNSQLDRIENKLESLETRIVMIGEHTEQISKTSEILGDIRNSLKTLSKTLVIIILVQALAVALGFAMAMQALTKTETNFSGFGMSGTFKGAK